MIFPLRILMVSDLSPTSLESGGERLLWEQASRLAKRGHHVCILSRSPGERTAEAVERQGVRISHFPVHRDFPFRFLCSSILQARRASGRALADMGADVLHLYQPLSGYGVLRSPGGRRIPSLYTFLSPAPLEYRSRRGLTGHHRTGWAGRLGAALLWALEGICLRLATRIHVLSDFAAGQLWKLYRISPDRIVKIPGGVDTDRFRPTPDREAVRKALGLPEAGPLLFTLRNLEARMGLDLLIRAMAILRQQLPTVRLLIGGSGPLRAELESLTASLALRDSVRFLGCVAEADLPSYYQAADLFVLPSRELEGFGLITVEALACGTPVLGTGVGATPEILVPLNPSLLFRDATPEAMAEDLRRLLEAGARDPLATLRLRRACRRHAEALYAWEASVSRLETVLSELAPGQGSPRVARTPSP